MKILGKIRTVMDSVGGVSVSFSFKNDSEKTIKYAVFVFVPYNAVNDVQTCDIKHCSESPLKYTGPLPPNGSAFGLVGENLWYNNSIVRAELTNVVIDYMDGSVEILKKEEIQYEETLGCYIATSVYGSYDCPPVWTLRRFRDDILAQSRKGRAFIQVYYALSPTLVKYFGKNECFQKLCRRPLDNLVYHLQKRGLKDTPYQDKTWQVKRKD